MGNIFCAEQFQWNQSLFSPLANTQSVHHQKQIKIYGQSYENNEKQIEQLYRKYKKEQKNKKSLLIKYSEMIRKERKKFIDQNQDQTSENGSIGKICKDHYENNKQNYNNQTMKNWDDQNLKKEDLFVIDVNESFRRYKTAECFNKQNDVTFHPYLLNPQQYRLRRSYSMNNKVNLRFSRKQSSTKQKIDDSITIQQKSTINKKNNLSKFQSFTSLTYNKQTLKRSNSNQDEDNNCKLIEDKKFFMQEDLDCYSDEDDCEVKLNDDSCFISKDGYMIYDSAQFKDGYNINLVRFNTSTFEKQIDFNEENQEEEYQYLFEILVNDGGSDGN